MSLVNLREALSRERDILLLAREYRWYIAGVGGTALTAYLLYSWGRPQAAGTPPPGPRGWPIIGNMLDMSRDIHLDGVRLREKYGDIVSLNVFGSCMVILNGPAALKEAFVKNAEDMSTTIPILGTIQEMMEFEDDIFGKPYNSGEWLEHKKFAVRTLRNFGFGSNVGENKILGEIDKMISSLSSSNCEPLNPRDLTQKTAAAVVFSVLLGKAWEQDDPEFLDLLAKEKNWASFIFGEESTEINKMDECPYLFRKILYRGVRKRFQKAVTDYVEGLERIIAEHIPECDVDNPRDVIDAYIRERGPGLQTRRLACNIVMFSTDAIDTLSSAFSYMLFYLAKYPDVQSRVHAQIDAVVGPSRKVMLKDKGSLPLVEAVVYETLRIFTFAPILLPRVAQNDVHLQGYVIPRNAMLFANIWSVHMDPGRFPEPNHFRLDHFLDNKGSLKPQDYFLPFGIGRRVCMGEQLARMELFLMLGNILQNFTVSFTEGFVPYEDDGYISNGFLRELPPFEIIFTPR